MSRWNSFAAFRSNPDPSVFGDPRYRHEQFTAPRDDRIIVTAITSRTGIVAHINVFTVAPEKQQLLIDSLIETINAARTVPGWLSARLHRSYDGTRVVNYVQYESQEAAQAVLRHLAAGGYLKRNTELGAVAPGQYEVVYTLEKE